MKHTAAALLLALAACGSDEGGNGDPDAADEIDGAPSDGGGVDGLPTSPLEPPGQLTMVGSGYTFTEGPHASPLIGGVLFSDIQGNTIYRWPGSGAPVVWRMPSGNANGLSSDGAGWILACEHGNRRISLGINNSPTTVVDRFEGARLNSPNDITVRSDGTIYFTDPPYGIQDAQRELAFMGVFRIAPGGALTAEHRGALTDRPNGIALSPDERLLYVGDSEANVVRVFDVATDGSLSNRRMFVTTATTPDGMAVDTEGNLYVATSAGVEVYAPTGSRWGAIAVPMQPSNVAFTGDGSQTLFITARTAVFTIWVRVPGLARH